MKAQHSGILYEKDYMPLLHQMHGCYKHRLGPGDLAGRRKDTERVYGILVPHSSYKIAGPGMAWGYKLLSEHYFPETYVLLVPDTEKKYNHIVTVRDENVETIFGNCNIDIAFAQKLLETGLVFQADEIMEFALELQILFLQQASRDRVKLLKILPLIVPVTENLGKVAEELVKIKRDIVVIIASDFRNVNFCELGKEDGFRSDDKQLIKYLLQLDIKSIRNYLEKHKANFQGNGTFILGIEILKQLGVTQGEIVNYYKSGEISLENEQNSLVSLVF